MALNSLGGEMRRSDRPTPSMPVLALPEITPETIAEEAAAKIERRTVRLGRDAWLAIGKSASFENWKAIGAALAVGKGVALRATGVNQAWGCAYSRAFSDWIKRHGFERMPASTRSVAVELHEHADEITAWRDSLPVRQR